MKRSLIFLVFGFAIMVPLIALAQLPAPDAGVYQPVTDPSQLLGNAFVLLQLIKAHYWVGVALILVQAIKFGVSYSEKYSPFLASHGTVITSFLAAAAAFVGLLVAGQNLQMAFITFSISIGPMYLKDILQEIGLVPPDAPPASAAKPAPAILVAPSK